MDYATELYKILSLYFSGNKSRIKCLTNILLGLMKAATTNMSEVAKNMPGSTKLFSKYRRVQRFFSEVHLEPMGLAKYIIEQMIDTKKVKLILDRTNWKIGHTDVNILVLSIAWHGLSIPLFWHNLARAGNAKTIQRMKILSQAIRILGLERIEAFLADREFIGEDWFQWLDHYNIPFVIRIKDNSLLETRGKFRKAIKSFKTLSREHTRYISCFLWGVQLTVVGYKDKDGHVHILATNCNQNKALELYSIRWQIESMFLCLKSHGFNLEDTHISCPEKLDLLFGLLAILTCWNCKIGSWRNKIQPIKIKNHHRPAYNLFNYGLQVISTIMNNILDYAKDFKKIMKLIKLPWNKIEKIKKFDLCCV